MARLPQEWFLNTPVLWLTALLLEAAVRGPLRNAPGFVTKVFRLAVGTLIATGLLISLVWDPVLKTSKSSPVFTAIWILLLGLTPIVWVAWVIRTISGKSHQSMTHRVTAAVKAPNPTEAERIVRAERFSDVGGADDTKEQIRQIVQGHLHPERYQRYGVFRNGILLYGPRGTGKTFLARATAGEFGLNFESISAPNLLTRWTGPTGENIQSVFAQAATRRPVLFFIDEIDAVGAVRHDAMSDAGGAGRELNNITASLLSAIDQYRSIDGFVLMAATNRLDGLDEALIREGRFDAKIRLDLPDEATRANILEAQLSKKPWRRFDVREIASQTPGASAARLRALVDQAENYALAENRKIEVQDLCRALQARGGTDRS